MSYYRDPEEAEEIVASPPPATPAGGQAGPSNAQDQGASTSAATTSATPAERRQRETTSAAVLAARVRAEVAKAAVQPPKGRLLRKMQEKELDQKVAESKAQVGLLETRTAKEEAQIELLEQEKALQLQLHRQKMADLRARRSEEEELHSAKLLDMGVDLEDILKMRRLRGTDAETQTD